MSRGGEQLSCIDHRQKVSRSAAVGSARRRQGEEVVREKAFLEAFCTGVGWAFKVAEFLIGGWAREGLEKWFLG